MKPIRDYLKQSALAAAVAAGLGSAHAVTPRSFTGTAITENFDSLTATGTAVTLLTGWDAGHFSSNPQQGTTGGNGLTTVTDALVVDNGSHSTSGTPILGNFGTTGAADRALGSFPRTTPAGDQFLQMAIKNDSANPITTFELSYTGEQWRSSDASVQSLTLWYSATDATSGFVSMGSGFTFTSPNTSASGTLDGNATGNRTVITGTFTPATPIAPGSTIYIRWYDINDPVSDDFLAIDDFSFGLPVPAANILTFGPGATITGTNIAWYVPNGSNPASLKPTYTLSPGATCDHDNGITAYNFSSPVHYFVTNSDSTVTKDYTVTVTVLPPETALIWNVAGGDAWDLSSVNWLGQTTFAVMPFFPGAIVTFNKTAGGTITLASGMSPTSTTVSATSGTYTFTGSPIMTGPLTKSGGGTLQLNVTPANFTSTTVNGGTLVLQAGSGFGTGLVTMKNVTVNAGGQIRSNQANVTGNLTLSGGTYDEYSGGAGSLSGTIYLAADSNFSADGYGGLTINSTISGPGGLSWWCNGFFGGLVLTASNSYTGPTIVTQNHLICQDRNALGDGGALSISNGAWAQLNYTGDHVVSALTLGGVVQLPGTYGSYDSPALFKNNTYFTGTGTVTVPGAVRPLITSFGLPGNPAGITQIGSTITWAVPYPRDVTHLAPTFTLSSGTCSPAPGTTLDFTSPVHYIVTDGALTNDYLVTVTVVPALPVLDGITLWLDASATHTMTLSGGTVNEWRDQYGSSTKATTMRGTPTLVASGIGGKPTVHFDAAGYSCMHDGLNHPAPVTVFYVGRTAGGSNQRVLSANNNNWLLGYYGGFRDEAHFEGWVSNPQINAAGTDPHLYATTIGGTGQDSTVYGDGTLLASNKGGVQVPNDLQLNGYGIWNEFSDCDISEVLVYNRVLSSAELTSVGSYLAGKYALATSYPPANPYGSWASTHGLNGTAGSSTDPAFDADPNKDGVTNGLVWLIGGTTGNPLANSNSILPVPTDDGGKLVLSFKCLKSSARGTANLYVEYSKDLGGVGDPWHGVPVPDADLPDSGSGVGFVVAPITGSDYTKVTATIAAPALGGKIFGRLMATEN